VRINPDYAEAHYNLGIALAKQGRSEEATREFSEASRIRPSYQEARQALGELTRK